MLGSVCLGWKRAGHERLKASHACCKGQACARCQRYKQPCAWRWDHPDRAQLPLGHTALPDLVVDTVPPAGVSMEHVWQSTVLQHVWRRDSAHGSAKMPCALFDFRHKPQSTSQGPWGPLGPSWWVVCTARGTCHSLLCICKNRPQIAEQAPSLACPRLLQIIPQCVVEAVHDGSSCFQLPRYEPSLYVQPSWTSKHRACSASYGPNRGALTETHTSS